jgi:hypothetical protein
MWRLPLLNVASYSVNLTTLSLYWLLYDLWKLLLCCNCKVLPVIKRFRSSRTPLFSLHLPYSNRWNKIHFQKVVASCLQGKTLGIPFISVWRFEYEIMNRLFIQRRIQEKYKHSPAYIKKAGIYTLAQQTNKSSVQLFCNYFRKAQPYDKNVRQEFCKQNEPETLTL